jgi:hypothetical protein
MEFHGAARFGLGALALREARDGPGARGSQVMSVPCLVINGRIAGFGKKNIRELPGLLA